MKKTLLMALFLAAAIQAAHSQATVGYLQAGNDFASSAWRPLIYGPDTDAPLTIRTGQSADTFEVPTGTTVYHGPLLSGTGYTFAFFAGPAGTASNELTLYYTANFRTGRSAGLVHSLSFYVAGTEAGDQATFQIRVWNNQGGTLTTW